jgi:hypothetical protein
MRHRSPLFAAALIAAFAAGCTPLGRADLRGVDWATVAGPDLNCQGDTVNVIGADYHDIDEDNIDEAFVTMQCAADDKAPGQLEVFQGGTPRDNPTRISVVVHESQSIRLGSHVMFVGDQVFAKGVVVGSHHTRVVTASWQGKDKKRRYTPTDAVAMPGC